MIDGQPAARALTEAGTPRIERTIYLGLDQASCEAARGAGFTRSLAIPFQAQALLQAIESSEEERLRVLLVDDSDLIHKHTVPLLVGAGYDVDEAWDGEAGLQRLRERRPDLVLTDVEMPRLDGFSFCRAIKSDEQTADIPVVICSSLGEARDLEQGLRRRRRRLPGEAGGIRGAGQSAARPARLASGRSAGETILVVDDSAAVRHLVTDCLRRQGFRVTRRGRRRGRRRKGAGSRRPIWY